MGFQSGFYWYYTLGSTGIKLESEGSPSICFYTSETNDLILLGCDYTMQYNPLNYKLLQLVIYSPN